MDDGGTREQIIQKLQYAEAPTYLINVDDANGSGVVNNPAGGKAYKKVTDTFNVSLSLPNDYDFLYWKIKDKSTDYELANEEFLALSSLINPDTECTLLKAPQEGMKLYLIPVIADRPAVSNNEPKYNSAGVVKSSAIIIEFDKPMNPHSIYYTQDEIDELNEKYEPDEITFLKANANQYYGYKLNTDDDSNSTITFKNIQITNYNNSENLLMYFNAPQFDNTNKKLTITPKSNFPGGTTVFVTIEKNFYYQTQIYNNEQKFIYMSKAFSWNYLVNNKTN